MKNKWLIITLIILLTIIVFFLIIFLVSYLKNGKGFENGIIKISSKSNKVILDKTFDLDDIKDIEVKQDLGDVIFKETSNNNIQVVVYGENENDVDVNLSKNKLTIDYTIKKKFVLFNFGNINNQIIIYIPSNYSNNIRLKNDYGDCKFADLENASVNLDCDAGNVKLGKIKDAIIKCNYGNVEIDEILNKCNINADCGNVDIDKVSIKEISIIKADLGNVSINETNDIYIEANVDLGKMNINGNNRNADVTLKVNCDCGNININ